MGFNGLHSHWIIRRSTSTWLSRGQAWSEGPGELANLRPSVVRHNDPNDRNDPKNAIIMISDVHGDDMTIGFLHQHPCMV